MIIRAVFVRGLPTWALYEEEFLDILEEHDET